MSGLYGVPWPREAIPQRGEGLFIVHVCPLSLSLVSPALNERSAHTKIIGENCATSCTNRANLIYELRASDDYDGWVRR
jgi:hypothetical protein